MKNWRESDFCTKQTSHCCVGSQSNNQHNQGLWISASASDPQAWPKYKHGIVNLEISCNFFGSVTDIWPYGSTHPAPPLPRVFYAVYWADIVKPVHKPTNPRKHFTQNTNWRVRLKFKQSDDGLSEELLSPFQPSPRCGLVGGRRLKSVLFNWYWIVEISEAFGTNQAGHSSCLGIVM